MTPTHLLADSLEALRLETLRNFAILDTPCEQEFDTVVTLAQRLLGVPIALVSLVDDQRQWFKASCGLDAKETHRDHAFCAHAIHCDDIMVVEDATLDPRFADNPLVTGAPGIRFYAGAPLRPQAADPDLDLAAIGTLCVIDTKPGTLSDQDARVLRTLADLVSSLIRSRACAASAVQLSELTRDHAATLALQQLQLRQAERMAGIGSWRLDLADNSIVWSDHIYAIHGLPTGQMPTIDQALDFYPADRRKGIAELLERGAKNLESFDFESDFVTADGNLRRVRSVGEPQIINGHAVALIGVFQDITDRHEREQTLIQRADTDALTGLSNRACFEREIANAALVAERDRSPACLLLFDLDGFKGVNDTFGHAMGDEVLRLMADRLKRIAGGNFVARIGGDEFVMLVRRPRDCARIEHTIANILASLKHRVERDGRSRAVSVTIGAAFMEPEILRFNDWVRRADVALYEAKRAQRGTGRLFGSDAVIGDEMLQLQAA